MTTTTTRKLTTLAATVALFAVLGLIVLGVACLSAAFLASFNPLVGVPFTVAAVVNGIWAGKATMRLVLKINGVEVY